MFHQLGYSFHQLCTKQVPVLILLRLSCVSRCAGLWVQKQGQVQQCPNILQMMSLKKLHFFYPQRKTYCKIYSLVPGDGADSVQHLGLLLKKQV